MPGTARPSREPIRPRPDDPDCLAHQLGAAERAPVLHGRNPITSLVPEHDLLGQDEQWETEGVLRDRLPAGTRVVADDHTRLAVHASTSMMSYRPRPTNGEQTLATSEQARRNDPLLRSSRAPVRCAGSTGSRAQPRGRARSTGRWPSRRISTSRGRQTCRRGARMSPVTGSVHRSKYARTWVSGDVPVADGGTSGLTAGRATDLVSRYCSKPSMTVLPTDSARLVAAVWRVRRRKRSRR